jgi:hypothetical protein
MNDGICALRKLGDEESITEIQVLTLEKILMLAVPFAAGEIGA